MGLRGVVVVEDEESRNGASPSSGVYATEHVANRPIADHVLRELQSAGVRDVLIACSMDRTAEVRRALANVLVRDELRLGFAESPCPLDLPGALSLLAPLVGGAPCIVHLASGLLSEPLAPLVKHAEVGPADVVLIMHQQPGPGESLSAATQDTLHIADLNPEEPSLGMAGVRLFGPGALHHIGGASWRAGGDVDLTNVAERIAAAGGSLHVRLTDGWRNYRGDPLDLLELNQIALDRLRIDQRRGNGNGNQIVGRVQIHEGASVRSSVIIGPTIVGPGAHIADAYVGPYTSIGSGAHIEGAEIERSIILSGASVMHIGGRLVASVVGRDAQIFRDFSLPRAVRLRVDDGAEVALC